MELTNGDVYIDSDGDLCLVCEKCGTGFTHLIIVKRITQDMRVYDSISTPSEVDYHIRKKTNRKPIMNMKNIFKAILEHYKEVQ